MEDPAGAEVRHRGEHNKLTVHDARVLDQAAAVLRVHAVDLPAEHERRMPVDEARTAHAPPSIPIQRASLSRRKRRFGSGARHGAVRSIMLRLAVLTGTNLRGGIAGAFTRGHRGRLQGEQRESDGSSKGAAWGGKEWKHGPHSHLRQGAGCSLKLCLRVQNQIKKSLRGNNCKLNGVLCSSRKIAPSQISGDGWCVVA